MDSAIIIEMWDHIKDDLPEKSRSLVLKNILLVFEDNEIVDEDILREVRDYDQYCEEAIDMIYKESDIEFDDFEEEELEDREW